MSPWPGGDHSAECPSSARNCWHQTLGPKSGRVEGSLNLANLAPALRQRLHCLLAGCPSHWPNAWPRSTLSTETRPWRPRKPSQVRVVRVHCILVPFGLVEGHKPYFSDGIIPFSVRCQPLLILPVMFIMVMYKTFLHRQAFL